MGKAKPIQLCPETLEDRTVPAVTASFVGGILTVNGDSAANVILVAADAGGNIVVTERGGTVPIIGGVLATRDNTNLVIINGRNGADDLQTDRSLNVLDANGVLRKAASVVMRGGNGNDFLKVGHGGIVPDANGNVVDANGVVIGTVVGNASMFGDNGNDTLISGFGNDLMFGGRGDDNYVWPPGTLTDIWDGGPGRDTVTIIGNDGANDNFLLTAGLNGHATFARTNLVQFTVDIANTERIVLKPGTGDDTIIIGDLTGVRRLRRVIVDGGGGNDTLDATAQVNRRVRLSAVNVALA